jgi:hypothetical protein
MAGLSYNSVILYSHNASDGTLIQTWLSYLSLREPREAFMANSDVTLFRHNSSESMAFWKPSSI